MIIRALSSFFKIFIASALFAVPFLAFAAGTPTITITSPLDQATTTVGDTINIDFDAANLTTSYANIELSQNGSPVVQIGTVNILSTQTSYSVPWLVSSSLDSGTYTLSVGDGQQATTNAVGAGVTLIINGNSLAGPTPLINIDPSQVTFNGSTGTYNYDDPAQEAAFQQQLAGLYGNQNKQSQSDQAVAIVGDALVNSAGQCVGTALAKQVGTALVSALGGPAAVAPTSVPTNPTTYTLKELAAAPGAPSLDSIGYCIGNAMLQTLSDSVTNWINNDFQLPDGSTGSAYLKDPTQFFKNLADVTAGQFLGNFSVNGINLCSNFSLPLRLNLLQQYSRSYNQSAVCTLGTIVNNLSAFTGGDFSQGGWDGWLAMTQNPNNNYYGSYLQAENQLQIQLDHSKSNVQTDLQNGNGFLSFTKCTSYGPSRVVSGKTLPGLCTSSQRVTPGSLIAAAAIKNTQAGEERQIVANSFDQVVTALVTSMLSKLTNFAQGSSGGL